MCEFEPMEKYQSDCYSIWIYEFMVYYRFTMNGLVEQNNIQMIIIYSAGYSLFYWNGFVLVYSTDILW